MHNPHNEDFRQKHSSIKIKEWSTRNVKFPLVIILTVNFLLMGVLAVAFLKMPLSSKNQNLCLTEKCINSASSVLRAMDHNVDPCVDFYQYSCGGWIKENPVPEWSSTWDRLAVLRTSLMQNMRLLLERDSLLKKPEPDGVQKARALYKACIDTATIESKGIRPIEDILQAVGLSPSIPSKQQNNKPFDWLFTIARTRRLLGINILFGTNVAEDVRNSSVNKIVIEQVSPGFGERYLLQTQKFSTEIKNYKKYITQLLAAYGNFTENEFFSQEIVNFSTQIAKVMTPSEIRRSPNHLFHEVSLTDLSSGPGLDDESWKFINWTKYLNIIFNDTTVILDHNEDSAVLLDLQYLQKLAVLLKTTNPLTLERFIWWNVFSSVAPMTLARFRDLGFEFSQKLLGFQSKTPRWKTCVNNVNANFGLALSYLYINSHPELSLRNKALRMIEDIKMAFENSVENLDWMDEPTRERTLTKLHAIKSFVGYPGWIMNSTQLDNHYKRAFVIDGNLFDTFLNLTSAAVKKKLESIREVPDRNRWVATATTVNAFYSATLNSVTFPAGILKPPFYGNGADALDYGAIGAIMGHEITHGFDDQGRRYDEQGNLKQWWSVATLEHYHEKVRCIIDQYSQYRMPDLTDSFYVHGYNTQGENIADNGGLRAAFEAYKRHKSRFSHSVNQHLPGLGNRNPDQLFFLGFAQVWCGNSTLGALKSKLIDGVHSPNRIRVIGTLSNSREFAEAWKCPLGSPMNPIKKCQLW